MGETPDKFFSILEKYKNDAVDEMSLLPSEIKPDWYDGELLARGQRFVQKNYWNVSSSELESLYLLFAFTENLETLIYTRQSYTVDSAAKRYFETVMRVKSWYESDPWDKTSEAYKNIVVVRSLHSSASRKLNLKGKDAVEKEFEPVKATWGGSCPVAYLDKIPHSKYSEKLDFIKSKEKFITQPEMTITLFGFMGLTLLYPEKLGIFNASDEDLKGFVHLWRNIGHLLGIEDDINFCKGSLEEVKERCRALIEIAVIPNLYDLNKNWEHMSKCMIVGTTKFLQVVDYETTLLYLFWILDLPCEDFYGTISYWKRLKFAFCLLNMKYFQRITMFKEFMNISLHKKLVSFEQSETFEKLKNM